MKPFLTQLIHRLAKTFQNLLNKLPSHPISHLPASKVEICPIIMIPGSSATENRFNRMVKKLTEISIHVIVWFVLKSGMTDT